MLAPVPSTFGFQHTAARRRLRTQQVSFSFLSIVSTHSRPKAAATTHKKGCLTCNVSTHSRPKAAAIRIVIFHSNKKVSTHSRPKAAARFVGLPQCLYRAFQHTAARRRLRLIIKVPSNYNPVSTHSRPKAAAKHKEAMEAMNMFQHTAARRRLPNDKEGFTYLGRFQHTAARRRLLPT